MVYQAVKSDNQLEEKTDESGISLFEVSKESEKFELLNAVVDNAQVFEYQIPKKRELMLFGATFMKKGSLSRALKFCGQIVKKVVATLFSDYLTVFYVHYYCENSELGK